MEGKTLERLNTTVVTLEDFTFDYLKSEREYSFPETSGRKIFNQIAVYRVKPISAITHHAPIEKVIHDAEVSGKYRLMAFGDKVRDRATKVVIKELKEFKEPVKVGKEQGGGIQGFYYTRLEYLKRASTIPELKSFRED